MGCFSPPGNFRYGSVHGIKTELMVKLGAFWPPAGALLEKSWLERGPYEKQSWGSEQLQEGVEEVPLIKHDVQSPRILQDRQNSPSKKRSVVPASWLSTGNNVSIRSRVTYLHHSLNIQQQNESLPTRLSATAITAGRGLQRPPSGRE
jgi:hypothetical protein